MFINQSAHLGNQGTTVANTCCTAIGSQMVAQIFKIHHQAGSGQIIGDNLGAWCKGSFYISRCCQAPPDSVPGHESRSHHTVWIRRVCTGSDGSNNNTSVPNHLSPPPDINLK